MRAELQILREQEWFKNYLKELVREAPPIRPYNPDDPMSVEKWKADSWRREGFFLVLSRFGFDLKDLNGDANE